MTQCASVRYLAIRLHLMSTMPMSQDDLEGVTQGCLSKYGHGFLSCKPLGSKVRLYAAPSSSLYGKLGNGHSGHGAPLSNQDDVCRILGQEAT